MKPPLKHRLLNSIPVLVMARKINHLVFRAIHAVPFCRAIKLSQESDRSCKPSYRPNPVFHEELFNYQAHSAVRSVDWCDCCVDECSYIHSCLTAGRISFSCSWPLVAPASPCVKQAHKQPKAVVDVRSMELKPADKRVSFCRKGRWAVWKSRKQQQSHKSYAVMEEVLSLPGGGRVRSCKSDRANV